MNNDVKDTNYPKRYKVTKITRYDYEPDIKSSKFGYGLALFLTATTIPLAVYAYKNGVLGLGIGFSGFGIMAGGLSLKYLLESIMYEYKQLSQKDQFEIEEIPEQSEHFR